MLLATCVSIPSELLVFLFSFFMKRVYFTWGGGVTLKTFGVELKALHAVLCKDLLAMH